MANHRIDAVPADVTSAGLAFNFDVWTPGTIVQLCNVLWDSEYENVVDFATQADLDKHLSESWGPKLELQRVSYARPEQPIYLNIPINEAYSYNYMKVWNPTNIHEPGKAFYYFIQDVTHIAPQTTQFNIQLDVWQSFKWSIQFGRCFIERGHVGMLAGDYRDQSGRDIMATPEGFDVGQDMIEVMHAKHQIKEPSAPNPYSFLLVATADLNQSPGTADDPKLKTSTGTKMTFPTVSGRGITAEIGADLWVIQPGDFVGVLDKLSATPWVSKSILGIYMTPGVRTPNEVQNFLGGGHGNIRKPNNAQSHYNVDKLIPDFREKILASIPAQYRHLSKFTMYPYSAIELTTYQGSPIILKPELLSYKDLGITIDINILPPSPRAAIWPQWYGHRKSRHSNGDGEYLDMVTLVSDFPTLPVTNDSYLSFMASNKNSIAYQYTSADYAATRAVVGAQTGYQQAMMGIDLNKNLANQAVSYNTRQTDINSAALAMKTGVSMASSGLNAVASGLSGNLGGVVGGAHSMVVAGVNGAIDLNTMAQSSQLANSNTRANSALQTGYSQDIADSNLSLAKVFAAGDRANAIAGINAQVNDAKMLPPTTSGQLGGSTQIIYLEGGFTVHARIKRIDDAAVARIGDFWQRYGYAVNRYFHPTLLSLMSHFTFWKMADVTIRALWCPEIYRKTIKGMFIRGVTVWKNAFDIVGANVRENRPAVGRVTI